MERNVFMMGISPIFLGKGFRNWLNKEDLADTGPHCFQCGDKQASLPRIQYFRSETGFTATFWNCARTEREREFRWRFEISSCMDMDRNKVRKKQTEKKEMERGRGTRFWMLHKFLCVVWRRRYKVTQAKFLCVLSLQTVLVWTVWPR